MRVVTLLLVAVGHATEAASQHANDPFAAEHAAAAARNPEHARLDVVPAKAAFYQDEIVAVTLRFTTDAGGIFTVSNADSRLIRSDEIHLDHPERTTDPLRDYYRAAGAEAG